MNKWLLLLIVIGLAILGWFNRDKVSAFIISKGWGQYAGLKGPPGTPNPALDSAALAKRAYPALAIANSPFNLHFIAIYNNVKQSDPDFLTKDDWPMLLAQRTASELGGAPMPAPTPAPGIASAPLQPSALDSKPKNPISTVAPTVQLPGFQGSALDQRPAKQH